LEKDETYFILPGKIFELHGERTCAATLIVAEGGTLKIASGAKITFEDKGGIYSEGKILADGWNSKSPLDSRAYIDRQDNELPFGSIENAGQIILDGGYLNLSGKKTCGSIFKNVKFVGMTGRSLDEDSKNVFKSSPIVLMNAKGVRFSNVTISNCYSHGAQALYIKGGANIAIINSRIENCDQGGNYAVYIKAKNTVSIKNSLFEHNQFGALHCDYRESKHALEFFDCGINGCYFTGNYSQVINDLVAEKKMNVDVLKNLSNIKSGMGILFYGKGVFYCEVEKILRESNYYETDLDRVAVFD
jgi:hypothetical protein